LALLASFSSVSWCLGVEALPMFNTKTRSTQRHKGTKKSRKALVRERWDRAAFSPPCLFSLASLCLGVEIIPAALNTRTQRHQEDQKMIL
jgi:hypothetical protein